MTRRALGEENRIDFCGWTEEAGDEEGSGGKAGMEGGSMEKGNRNRWAFSG